MEKKIERVKKQLSKLSCPLIKQYDDTFIQEILTKSCVHRMEILNWLFQSILENEGISEHENLDSTQISEASLNESRIKDGGSKRKVPGGNVSEKRKLLKWASSIGLCKRTDSDIIEGSAPLERQLPFLIMLLDLVLIKQELTEKCLSDNSFNLSTLQDPHFEIFSIEPRPHSVEWSLPSCIQEVDLKEARNGTKKAAISDLEAQLEKLEKELEDKKQELKLKTEGSLPSYDPADIEPTTKLTNKLDEIFKISQRFFDLYAASPIVQFINKQTDATGVGYESKEILEKQTKLTECFQNFEKIRNALEYLSDKAQPEVEAISKKSVSCLN